MIFFKEIVHISRFLSISSEYKKIVFFSEGSNHWIYYKGIINSFLKKEMKVSFITSDANDHAFKINNKNFKVFYIGKNNTRDWVLKKIKAQYLITTTPDLGSNRIKLHNKSCHYIYIQHSICSLNMIYNDGAFDHFDTICCVGPHHLREIIEINKKRGFSKKRYLKLGYSKFDYLLKNKIKNKNSNKKNIILIAPTWGIDGIIESGLYRKIIDILNKNKDNEIILRPHPETIKNKEILKQLQNIKNIELDINTNGLTSIYKSNILISDYSGIVYEFTFLKKRKCILIDTPLKIKNKNYLSYSNKPIEFYEREKFGILIKDDQLYLIEQICKELFRDSLKFNLNEYLYNIGKSDDYFVSKFEDFKND